MGKLALRGLALAVVIGLLGVGSYAIAGGGSDKFNGSPLTGYEENLDLSTPGSGSFEARLSKDGTTLAYELTFGELEGVVTQSHVHFGKTALNGGISFWLCETATNPSPSDTTPACPSPGGTVRGEVTAAEVIGPATHGIAPGEFAEILAAMRAGHAYANVHTTTRPGGEIRAQINNGDDDNGENDD